MTKAQLIYILLFLSSVAFGQETKVHLPQIDGGGAVGGQTIQWIGSKWSPAIKTLYDQALNDGKFITSAFTGDMDTLSTCFGTAYNAAHTPYYYGHFQSFAFNSNYRYQLFTPFNTADLYLRVKTGSAWKSWVKINEAQNLSISGDQLTIERGNSITLPEYEDQEIRDSLTQHRIDINGISEYEDQEIRDSLTQHRIDINGISEYEDQEIRDSLTQHRIDINGIDQSDFYGKDFVDGKYTSQSFTGDMDTLSTCFGTAYNAAHTPYYYGHFQSYAFNTNYRYQLFTPFNTSDLYLRLKTGSAWNSWVKINEKAWAELGNDQLYTVKNIAIGAQSSLAKFLFRGDGSELGNVFQIVSSTTNQAFQGVYLGEGAKLGQEGVSGSFGARLNYDGGSNVFSIEMIDNGVVREALSIKRGNAAISLPLLPNSLLTTDATGQIVPASMGNGIAGNATVANPLSVNFTQGVVDGTGLTWSGISGMKVRGDISYNPTVSSISGGVKVSFPDASSFNIIGTQTTNVTGGGSNVFLESKNTYLTSFITGSSGLEANDYYTLIIDNNSLSEHGFFVNDSLFTVEQTGLYEITYRLSQNASSSADTDQIVLHNQNGSGSSGIYTSQITAPSSYLNHACDTNVVTLTNGTFYKLQRRTRDNGSASALRIIIKKLE